jgi:polar amino acid transport system substrate-binding protein
MKTLLSMLVIVLSFALFSCSQPQENAERNNTSPQTPQTESASAAPPKVPECSFKIGFDIWEPYQFLDVDDSARGLDIELISAITESMNCDVEFIQGTWVNLLKELQEGNIDILLGASKTNAREEFAYFSNPYRTEEFVLYIRADDTQRESYQNIEEFIENGSKIGLVGDYYYGDNISEIIESEEGQKHIVFAIMGELNIARLLDMDIDGFLEDSYVGPSMLRRKALGDLIKAHPYSIETGEIYVMFSQASVTKEHVSDFNEALADYKNSQGYADTLQKYGM